jgi:hypothetical protein
MRTARWAAIPTLLMAVFNIGAGPGSTDTPAALAWGATVLGLIGLVAGISLLRRASWARTAVIVIGALNVAGGVLALVQDYPGAVVGLVLGAAAVALCFLPGADSRRADRTATRAL